MASHYAYSYIYVGLWIWSLGFYWFSDNHSFNSGPTNTLLASSGIQVGIRKSLRLIPAEAFGYLISITAWGFLIGKVSVHLPLLPTILKLFSASYIIYLAIKLWRTADVEVSFNQPTIRARELFWQHYWTLKHCYLLLPLSRLLRGQNWIITCHICRCFWCWLFR